MRNARWQFDPPADLRRQASEALKRRGIHYLLVSQGAPYQESFRKDAAAWGWSVVAATEDATLYRME